MSFFQRVFEVVRQIPKGKVMTYGDVAKVVGTRDARRVGPHFAKASRGKQDITPRMVGWALHANRDPEIPCHRVVFADGRLAAGYAFGGEGKQREKLESEGVKFTDEGKVDLKACRDLSPVF